MSLHPGCSIQAVNAPDVLLQIQTHLVSDLRGTNEAFQESLRHRESTHEALERKIMLLSDENHVLKEKLMGLDSHLLQVQEGCQTLSEEYKICKEQLEVLSISEQIFEYGHPYFFNILQGLLSCYRNLSW